MIKTKWQWQNSLKFQYSFKIGNTQLNRKQVTPNYFIILISNYAKFCDWDFESEICLSPDLMSDIFEVIKKPYFLWVNLQFRPENPNDKIWHRIRKISRRILFQMNVKLSSTLWILRQKQKLRFQKTVLESYAKQMTINRFYLTFPNDDSL